ncbi:Transmembrane protein 87A [Linum perenne]
MEITHRSLILILFLTHRFLLASASIHIYNSQPFSEVGNAFLLSGGSEGIVASTGAAALPPYTVDYSSYAIPRSIHDGRSYISSVLSNAMLNRFENITFWRSKAAADEDPDMDHDTGLVQVVMFEAADRNSIGGSAYGGQRSICCTADLAKLEGCKEGQVIRIPSATDINWPILLNVNFRGDDLSTKLNDEDVYITKTGMYNLFFVACDPKLKGLVMSGKTIWKNPDGYLPGRMAPLRKFYVLMSVAYVLLSLIWFTQYLRFWKDILQLQHCITAVIALGLFEMVLWYAEYVNFNSLGIRPVSITTWVVTIGAVRKTVSRLLLLSVSMGYGVVRPTLGGLTSKVLLLGMTYFLASELLDITEYVGTINDISGRARLLLVLPAAFLDAFLILWIFTSLQKTLEQLQSKRSSVKLDIYRKFSNALAVSVIASVVWIFYEVYFKATDPFNERWQSAWIITAFWDLVTYVLLCVICYLWAPSVNSQRYAYSEEVGEDFDEETQSLTRGKPDGDISLVESKENNINTLDEEEVLLEEDKRE